MRGGELAKYVEPNKYTGIDISHASINKAKRDFPAHSFIEKDFLETELSQCYDTICLLTVLEFMPYPGRMLRKCYGQLNADGNLVVCVPGWLVGRLNEFLYRKTPSGGVSANFFTKQRLVALLLEAGFSIKKFRRYNLGLSYFVVASKKTD